MSRRDYVDWKEASDDLESMAAAEMEAEARDRQRFGGPVTNGMLMSAINACAIEGVIAHDIIDCEKLARIVNSWLVPTS